MKRVFLAALWGVTILFFILLMWAGIRDVAYAFMGINPLYLPVIVGLPFLMMFLYSIRWSMLLRAVGVEAEWGLVWRYSLIGAALNNITPMVRFGGEPLKCYLLARELSVGKRTVLASITMDSVITAVSLLVLIYIGVFGMAMLNIVDMVTLGVIVGILLAPLAVGAYVIYDKRVLRAFSRSAKGFITRFSDDMGKEAEEQIMEFRENISGSAKKLDVMSKAMALGLTERFLEVVGLYVIFQSLGIDLGLYASAVVLGVGILAGLIPLLPGGLIVYESSTILVLGVLGVHPALAAISILLWRGATYWMITGVGVTLGWLHGLKFALSSALRSGDVASPKI